MNVARRVLVTGPVERLEAWCDAARGAGWEPVAYPLVEIMPLAIEARAAIGARAFDVMCVTSPNALAFAERAAPELPNVRGAAVGELSARRLEELGIELVVDACSSAKELANELIARFPGKTRVFWPRGDRSDELARTLRSHGFDVVDPIVYSTRDVAQAPAPECDAMLFASPSAVAAWGESDQSSPRIAIAIGRTTCDALLAEPDLGFGRIITLPEPSPEAFAFQLAHVG